MEAGGLENANAERLHLGASMMIMSATLPRSREPWVAERPREAAAFSVAATNASGMVMRRFTHARCITAGCKDDIIWVKLLRGHTHTNTHTHTGDTRSRE